MKPKEPEDGGPRDLFRSRLDQILDMGHPKGGWRDGSTGDFCRTS